MCEQEFDEIVEIAEDGQRLVALINGDVGWLMYLRHDGDAGFSSRNPDHDGPPEATIEYELSNGQHDWYPASWALPLEQVMRALDYFRERRKQPPFIHWHNDSRDGVTPEFHEP